MISASKWLSTNTRLARAFSTHVRVKTDINGSSPHINGKSGSTINGVNGAYSRLENLRKQIKKEVVSPPPKSAQDAVVFPSYTGINIEAPHFKLYTKSLIKELFNKKLPDTDHRPYTAVASVLPMRSNNYVVDELIDWNNVPNDPIFQLTFPHPDMLIPQDLNNVMNLLESNVSKVDFREQVEKIRDKLNPHPAGQKQLNVPKVGNEEVPGMQHKYRETALFFPMEAQYCQSYCTYCFRWAQFTAVGSKQQFSCKDAELLKSYLKENRQISDILFTGGDPMVMKARHFHKYLDPILEDPSMSQLATVRIGTKSLAYWPYRYISDDDSDDIMRLFENIVKSGRHLSIMAHFSHPAELSTPAVREAIRRIRNTGAQIRTQAPIINHVNADERIWSDMWRIQTRLGLIPYYMFQARDTGARDYFKVSLEQAYNVFSKAFSSIAGSARTVRGPSMSCEPGKVHVIGITNVGQEKVFVLKFLQARNPEWSEKVFFAKYDPEASWFSDLVPAFGEEKFFFEEEFSDIKNRTQSSGQLFPFREGFTYDAAKYQFQR
mmetsp:Transcript_13337/g.17095  ORF Transcript_13337/g.17095 Transcript_13337/m.17095 type:complete len:549 (+) Transcript_13337:110-1756(+)